MGGTPVLYIDSPGHRAPTTSTTDLHRMVHRLALWRPTARPVRPGLWRDSPLLIPNYRHQSIVRLNEQLLRWRFRRNARTLHLVRPLLWTYTPLGGQVYNPHEHEGLIYHCVDDIAAFPGVNSNHYRRSEQALVQAADVCIGSSRHLVHHLRSLGARDVRYWPNPADTEAFANAAITTAGPPKRTRKVAGFLGAIQEHKVDVELIRNCANALPDVDFVIAGPLGFGLGRSKFDPSSFPKNVTFPGSVSKEDAPKLVSAFDVGIIPYRVNQYTAGVFPMKVFEYLAAGLPVVSTRLPSLDGEVDHVVLGETHSQFIAALRTCLAQPFDGNAADTRSLYASKFSWQHRVEQAVSLIAEVRQRPSRV